jgi:hypothetical protein
LRRHANTNGGRDRRNAVLPALGSNFADTLIGVQT